MLHKQGTGPLVFEEGLETFEYFLKRKELGIYNQCFILLKVVLRGLNLKDPTLLRKNIKP